MGSVFSVTVSGTHQLKGCYDTETYLVDLGEGGRFPDAKRRAEFEAKRLAFADGIAPESATARQTDDYGRCPNCGDPIAPSEFE